MATQELICSITSCWCGAKPGEYCMGAFGRRSSSAGGRHADRCVTASRWRKQNRAEWSRLHNAMFTFILGELEKEKKAHDDNG